jgi:cytochrome c-type biogenesis protein CcmH
MRALNHRRVIGNPQRILNKDLINPFMTDTTHSAFDLPTVRRQLLEINALHQQGVLSEAAFENARTKLEQRIVDLVLNGEQPAALVVAASTDSKSASRESIPLKLLLSLGAGVVAVAAAGYFWLGTPPTQIAAESGDAAGQVAGSKPHSTNFDQIAEMTDKLSARLKENPQDFEGWAMLARSYTVLGRNADALSAFEKANALRGNDAVLLADYADALALKNNRVLTGEPMKLVERALKLDPKNLKALSLAGTHAFEMKNYAMAVKYWESMVQTGPSTDNLIEQILPGLAQAREMAGLPPSSKLPVAVEQKTVGASKTVSGTVRLSPSLASQAAPEDTVYVFARPGDGSRMPLAILQKKVKDLPLQFTLDDSMAMSPSTTISKADKVVIVARISKSGNAMPQKGDLSGQTDAVKVGAEPVSIEIREIVK